MPPVIKLSKKISQEMKQKAENSPKKNVVSGQLEKRIKLKKIARKKQRANKRPARGVVFLKNLPHGFFEAQLKSYFKQFGKVTRLRLVRSKRSGNSKGFAFVEFAIPEVAKVASETMDNYQMFQKLVKSAYIPPEEQKFNYFRTSVKRVPNPAGKLIYVSERTRRINKQARKINTWNEENYDTRTQNTLAKLDKLKKKHSQLGIDFEEYAVSNDLIKKIKKTYPVKASTSNTKTEKHIEVVDKKQKLAKKQKAALESEMGLKYIMEDTLKDESSSSDDDYNPDINETVSDNNILVTNEDGFESLESDSDEEYSEILEKPSKPRSQPKLDRLDQIIKRKPLTGGIQKQKKKERKPVRSAFKEENLKYAAHNVLKTSTVQRLKKKDLKKKKT